MKRFHLSSAILLTLTLLTLPSCGDNDDPVRADTSYVASLYHIPATILSGPQVPAQNTIISISLAITPDSQSTRLSSDGASSTKMTQNSHSSFQGVAENHSDLATTHLGLRAAGSYNLYEVQTISFDSEQGTAAGETKSVNTIPADPDQIFCHLMAPTSDGTVDMYVFACRLLSSDLSKVILEVNFSAPAQALSSKGPEMSVTNPTVEEMAQSVANEIAAGWQYYLTLGEEDGTSTSHSVTGIQRLGDSALVMDITSASSAGDLFQSVSTTNSQQVVSVFQTAPATGTTVDFRNNTGQDMDLYVKPFLTDGSASEQIIKAWTACKWVDWVKGCQITIGNGKTITVPNPTGAHLNITSSLGGWPGLNHTEIETNVNNGEFSNVDVSLVDGFNYNAYIDKIVGSVVTTIAGPTNGAHDNKSVTGVFPWGCSTCAGGPGGAVQPDGNCKDGTESDPKPVPCQIKIGAGTFTVRATFSP